MSQMASSSSSASTIFKYGQTCDRNAFALAIVSALIAGACIGSIAADYGARSTDMGYEPTVFAESITGALFLGAVLNGIVSSSRS
jgi:hypothetical protein